MSGEEQIPVPVSELRGHTSASIMVIGMKVFEELASAPDGEHWKDRLRFMCIGTAISPI
jgi:hypothetical protein